MNPARKTLFWIITLLLVAGGFYFYDQRATEQNLQVEESLKMFPFTVEEVDEFLIVSAQAGQVAKVHRENGEWWLNEPIVAKGDAAKIDSVLTNVVLARKDRTLFEEVDANKLRELGLESPELEMAFTVSGKEHRILFGGVGPTHNIAYAMLSDDPKVYRIHSDIKAEANKEVYDLRDKSLLSFDPVKLKRFEMTRRDQPRVVVEHDNGRWNLIEPARANASMENVLEGLYMIKETEIQAFLGEVPENREVNGLASPRIHLTIYDEQREDPYVLIVGDKDRVRRGYFALTNRSEEMLVVTEDLVNYLLSVKDNWQESSS